MLRKARAKQERVIEAVRQGLEGEAAVAFLHQSGYAMTSAGIARHLRNLGGRGSIVEQIEAGRTNAEVLAAAFPEEGTAPVPDEAPSQGDLFEAAPQAAPAPLPFPKEDLFETTRLTLRIPTDLHTALRLAAHAEGTTQAQLIIDLLTSAMSRMPNLPPEEDGDG